MLSTFRFSISAALVLNAAGAASPDSIDNKDQPSRSSENWQAAWQAVESEHPDFG